MADEEVTQDYLHLMARTDNIPDDTLNPTTHSTLQIERQRERNEPIYRDLLLYQKVLNDDVDAVEHIPDFFLRMNKFLCEIVVDYKVLMVEYQERKAALKKGLIFGDVMEPTGVSSLLEDIQEIYDFGTFGAIWRNLMDAEEYPDAANILLPPNNILAKVFEEEFSENTLDDAQQTLDSYFGYHG